MILINKHSGKPFYVETIDSQGMDYGIKLLVKSDKDSANSQMFFYDSITAFCRDWEDA